MFSDESRAYVLGLLVAGGTFSPNTFFVELPFDQWGNDPQTLNAIALSLITSTRKTFLDAYGIECNFTISKKNCWRLTPIAVEGAQALEFSDSLQAIRNDLKSLGLPNKGFLLNMADLKLCREMLTPAAARKFLTGFFDARASLTRSHRRFNEENLMVSIEVPGSTMNFGLVVQLCSWMTSLGSITDQIIYNHPSMHASDDPLYKQWRKGFKIRLTGRSFFENHSFGISPKGFDVKQLAEDQVAQVQKDCVKRDFKAGDRSLHKDLGAEDLPEPARGRAFLHYLHICAALGCPYAPRDSVRVAVRSYRQRISVFPICSKGTVSSVTALFDQIHRSRFEELRVEESKFSLAEVLHRFDRLKYPEIEGALKFLAADGVRGKRYSGAGAKILSDNENLMIRVRTLVANDPMSYPPILLVRDSVDRACLVSTIIGKSNADELERLTSLNGLAIEVDTQKVLEIYGP